MSNRKRSRAGSPRRSEAKALKAAWEAEGSDGKPLPSQWEIVQAMLDNSLPQHPGSLFRELMLVASITDDPVLHCAARRLLELGLGGKEWKTVVKERADALVQPFDLIRDLFMDWEIKNGATERQAAERVAARMGGSASFEAAVQAARTGHKKSRRN